MRDLVVLVPDKNTEHAVRGAFRRDKALGIRAIDFEVIVDQGRDGGVRRRGTQILQVERRGFSHALLMFDYEGSGAATSREDLEADLDAALLPVWGTNAKSIVIEPEVDIWMWGAETHLREVIGWRAALGIRDWLKARDFGFTADGKPDRPKEALEAIFREAREPRSSAHYEALARRLSLQRCQDEAFIRLRQALIGWFPR